MKKEVVLCRHEKHENKHYEMKIMQKGKQTRKRFLFFFFFVFSFILFFLLQNVCAQEFWWCVKTKEDKTCQPNTLQEHCKEGYYIEKPNECEIVNCVLENGVCQTNVPRKTCEEANGKAIEIENTKEKVENCIKGCCIIAGQYEGIITSYECYLRASERNMLDFLDFDREITNEEMCMKKVEKKEKGCCFTSVYDCVYTTRENCVANFVANKFCSEIPQCNAQPHFSLKCGKKQLGDDTKLCWFDSGGNQEDCMDCGYPAYTCDICKDKECYDEKNDKTVTRYQSYCKSTKCDLSNAKESQVLKWDGGKMKLEWKKPPSILLNGESTCYNFYTGQAKVGEETFDNGFPRVSTGLQNQILRCKLGDVEIDGLGVDRSLLCFESNSRKTHTEKNKHYNCMKCGKPVSKLEKQQEILQEKSEQINKLQQELADSLNARGIDMNSLSQDQLLDLLNSPEFSDLLNKFNKIQELQREMEAEAEKMDLEWYDYLGLFFASLPDEWANYYSQGMVLPGFATVKFYIFSKLGGNVCEKEDCESEKFSNGESYCIWRSKTGSSGEVVWITLWAPVDRACVPRYPPGLVCGSCGGTGDNDECEEEEAWASGDCIFKPTPSKSLFYLIPKLTTIFSVTRYNLIPWYTLLEAIAYCSGAVLFPVCFWWWWKTRLWIEIGWYETINSIVEVLLSAAVKIYQTTT